MPQNLKTYKTLSSFEELRKIKSDGSFLHDVSLIVKIKNSYEKSRWYAKSLEKNRKEAILETLAQEFFRLILPQQPKTRRLAYEIKQNIIGYYVLSKEIPEFDNKFFSAPNNNELILDGRITGLAATQVLALWLNEVDFKASNLGIDKNGKVIKIDGGLSLIKLNPMFKDLYEGKNLDITRADLEALPNLINYEACNWLHHIQWNSDERRGIKTKPTERDKAINKNSNFKNEVYQTILRIISLPDQLIQYFMKNYVTNLNDIKVASNFINARKQQLASAAEQIPVFNEYRQSNQAREEMLDFLSYLETFKTMHKSSLLSEFNGKYKTNIEADMLRNVIKEYTSIENFIIEINDYLKQLSITINFYESEFKKDRLLPDRKKIISDIVPLKETIREYLASPTLIKKNALYNTLSDVVEAIEKKESIMGNSIISVLTKSINKLLFANDGLEKIKKPIPTPQKNNVIQALPSISFFNGKSQKMSTGYCRNDMDVQSQNSKLFNG